MAKVYDFSPSRLKAGETQFLLSTAEWLTIQVYARCAAALPITEKEMRERLKLAAGDPIAPYQAIIDAYKDIHDHCEVWSETTFPETVRLASDIVSYSRTAPAYYNALKEPAAQLIANPKNEQAKKTLVGILTTLSGMVKRYSERATTSADNVAKFATQTSRDQIVMQGDDGKSGLVGSYEAKYGATSEEGKMLITQLAAANNALREARAEYERDVIIAATTPTYAFVPVYGWIAAPTVAGIYTKKALDALEAADRAYNEIKRLEAKQARNTILLAELGRAKTGLGDIRTAMNAAKPKIDKIRGAWDALASDLGNLADDVKNNLVDMAVALPEIVGPGIESSIESWKAIGAAADKYRVNAYVQFEEKAA